MRLAFCFVLAAAAPVVMAQFPGNEPVIPGAPGSAASRLPGNDSAAGPNMPAGIGDQAGRTVPVMFFGRVSMADGSRIPSGTSIVRSCSSGQVTVAFTDAKGQFNYQPGSQGSMALPDASDQSDSIINGRQARMGAPRGADYAKSEAGCELRVDLPGYVSDTLPLDRSKSFANPDLATIVVHRLPNVEGTAISATLLSAPPDARKAYEKGLQSYQKGRYPDAEKDLQKAVTAYAKFANAWLALGRTKLREDQTGPAHEAFLKAVDADPKLVEAQMELGVMAAQEKKWQEAAQYLDAVLRLDPVDFPQLWFTDAVANFNSRNYDQAEKMAREALKADPAHKNPMVNQLLGMALAQKHDFGAAAEQLRLYLKLAPTASDFATVKEQLARIEEQLAKSPQ